MASIIDGKAVAKEVQKQIKEEVEGLERRWGLVPGLGVVLVGDDPGSHIYVKNKEKACKEVGIKSYEHLLPATVSERELLTLVHSLNKDKNVHGILVQLPLPAHIRSEKILEAVSPHKDVDGFHPVSQGMLVLGGDGFRPCTPMGIMKLLESVGCDPKGKERCGRRPQQYRGQTGGVNAARTARNGDDLSFADGKPAGRGGACRYSRGCHRQGGFSSGRLGQAGCCGDRRGSESVAERKVSRRC